MAEVKSTAEIAAKFARVTPTRAKDYQDGVRSPRKRWDEATLAAQDNWQQGIQQAASEGRFGAGVQAAGHAKWQANTLKKGPGRWQQGVAQAAENFAKGFAPYREALASVQLPARGPKGDPNNIERVRVVAATLNQVKRQLRGQ